MSTDSLERVPDRLVRLVEFGGVGALGMVVDLSIVWLLLSADVHYLLANTAAFATAVSFNFAGNWWVTFDRPSGSLVRQYLSYVGLHSLTFGLRAAAVTGLVAGAGVAAGPATLVGVGVAAVANFLGTEQILLDDREWLDATAALNSFAHRIYSSRLRAWLQALGLYSAAYGAYMRLLARIHRDDRISVEAGGVSAELHAERPPEIVSVSHSIEKEGQILEQFVDAVEPGDVVWDIGANLGVFACLAGRVGAEVVAVEPHAETAQRCRENLDLNDVSGRVEQLALGADAGEVQLAVERDEVGTQTPTIDSDGSQTVAVERGDELDAPAPDVIKIDVEGHEAAVLEGMGHLLKGMRVAIVETHGNDVSRYLRREFSSVKCSALSDQKYIIAVDGF